MPLITCIRLTPYGIQYRLALVCNCRTSIKALSWLRYLEAVLILGRDMSLDGTAWDSPRTWTEGVMSLDIWDIYIIYCIYTVYTLFGKLIIKLKSIYMIILPSNGPILMNIFLFCSSY